MTLEIVGLLQPLRVLSTNSIKNNWNQPAERVKQLNELQIYK